MMEKSSHLPLRRPSQPSRRELRGPRPWALKVGEGSHKIRKQPPPSRRGPVIIYTVSPKVIHATCGEFMSLVQRLTGAVQERGTTASLTPASGGGAEWRKRSEEAALGGGGQ